MKALFNDKAIAEAPKDELIYTEGNWYFPPQGVAPDALRENDTEYHCPWKGDSQYYDVGDGETWAKDGAWSYPEPFPSAIQKIGKDFSGYVAFAPGVAEVTD